MIGLIFILLFAAAPSIIVVAAGLLDDLLAVTSYVALSISDLTLAVIGGPAVTVKAVGGNGPIPVSDRFWAHTGFASLNAFSGETVVFNVYGPEGETVYLAMIHRAKSDTKPVKTWVLTLVGGAAEFAYTFPKARYWSMPVPSHHESEFILLARLGSSPIVDEQWVCDYRVRILVQGFRLSWDVVKMDVKFVGSDPYLGTWSEVGAQIGYLADIYLAPRLDGVPWHEYAGQWSLKMERDITRLAGAVKQSLARMGVPRFSVWVFSDQDRDSQMYRETGCSTLVHVVLRGFKPDTLSFDTGGIISETFTVTGASVSVDMSKYRAVDWRFGLYITWSGRDVGSNLVLRGSTVARLEARAALWSWLDIDVANIKVYVDGQYAATIGSGGSYKLAGEEGGSCRVRFETVEKQLDYGLSLPKISRTVIVTFQPGTQPPPPEPPELRAWTGGYGQPQTVFHDGEPVTAWASTSKAGTLRIYLDGQLAAEWVLNAPGAKSTTLYPGAGSHTLVAELTTGGRTWTSEPWQFQVEGETPPGPPPDEQEPQPPTEQPWLPTELLALRDALAAVVIATASALSSLAAWFVARKLGFMQPS